MTTASPPPPRQSKRRLCKTQIQTRITPLLGSIGDRACLAMSARSSVIAANHVLIAPSPTSDVIIRDLVSVGTGPDVRIQVIQLLQTEQRTAEEGPAGTTAPTLYLSKSHRLLSKRTAILLRTIPAKADSWRVMRGLMSKLR